MTMSKLRTYSELIQLPTFEERFNYLKLDGSVGRDTFGFDRYMNQRFYRSALWKRIRSEVILRDMGCDLGVPGFDIETQVCVHHMNPIFPDDLVEVSDYLTNKEYLITTCHKTHNAIHYGDSNTLSSYSVVERKPNDTCPWKGGSNGIRG